MTGVQVKKTSGKPRVGDGTPGPGRPRGGTNKMTADLKAMILAALDKAGGAEYLYRQSLQNPKAFLSLLGRVLPLTVAGDPDNPLLVSISERLRRAEERVVGERA